jgi:hypothetical protein
VSGTVVDPSGKNPVYGAVVYIPDQPDKIDDISQGPGNLCGRCAQPSGSPIAGAVTGPDGSFTLTQTPVGRQIPLVVQLGKWRRMSFIDINNACADNPITDPDLTRLPRNRSDGSKASLPKIAIAAGAADRLQCLLLRMGVDASEFTNPDGTRVGQSLQPATRPGRRSQRSLRPWGEQRGRLPRRRRFLVGHQSAREIRRGSSRLRG